MFQILTSRNDKEKAIFSMMEWAVVRLGELGIGDFFIFENVVDLLEAEDKKPPVFRRPPEEVIREEVYRVIPPIYLPNGEVRNAAWERTQGWYFFEDDVYVIYCGTSILPVDVERSLQQERDERLAASAVPDRPVKPPPQEKLEEQIQQLDFLALDAPIEV